MRPTDFLAGNPVLLPGMGKPRIIVLSDDDADEFRWLSDGWFEMKKRHRPAAQELFAKASACVEAAADVPDAVRRLRAAGFVVTRDLSLLPPDFLTGNQL